MKSHSKSAFHIVALFAIMTSLLGSALTVTPAYAAGIIVNTTSDENNTGTSCSLREAITAANTNAAYGGCTAGSGADIITLPAGTYTLTVDGAGEDANASGDLDIISSLTINGAGAGSTIIRAGATSGSGIDRVLHVFGTGIFVSISDVTIANGKCAACDGGGIYHTPQLTLTLTNTTFSGNSAANLGGGIYSCGAYHLNITNSTFSGNSAGSGGGIYGYCGGTVNVTNSTFSANSALNEGGAITNSSSNVMNVTNSMFSGNSANSGGGITNFNGSLTVTNSTFSGNSAVSGNGGGVYNYGSGNLILANSTFSANSAATYGGGIDNDDGTTTLTNSTFSGNTAAIYGGGVFNNSTGVLHLINIILANSPSGSDCYNNSGTITTNTNNLIEVNAAGANACGTPAVTINPGLGALANNGGPTETFALPTSSSAIDAGDNSACPATDQRGVTRPQNGVCDIGSYEAPDITSPTISSSVRVDPDPTALSNVNFTVTFSEPVTGVDAGDMGLITTGTINSASITNVSGSGATRTVTVNTGVGQGTIHLDIHNNLSIQDLANNSLSGGDFTSGETYTVTRSPVFADVSYNYWANSFIERLFHASITGGCSVSPLNYCPENLVTRDQMAIFLERGIQGSSFVPPNVVPTFGDTAGNFAEDWIEALKNDGITGGCGNGNYCPTSGVTRAQMAIFLERSMHGPSFVPPNVVPTFGDTTGNFAEDWIEALKIDAITSGCGNGNYCPDDVVTRAQMAVFLVKAFNLP